MDAGERIDILLKKFTQQTVAAILGIETTDVANVRLNPASGQQVSIAGGPIIVRVGGPVVVDDPTGAGAIGTKLATVELPQPCYQIVLAVAAKSYQIIQHSAYEPRVDDFSVVALPAGTPLKDIDNYPNGMWLNGMVLRTQDGFPGFVMGEQFNPSGSPGTIITRPDAIAPATAVDFWLASYPPSEITGNPPGEYPMGLRLPDGIEIHVA